MLAERWLRPAAIRPGDARLLTRELHQLFIPHLMEWHRANSLTYANDDNYNYLCVGME